MILVEENWSSKTIRSLRDWGVHNRERRPMKLSKVGKWQSDRNKIKEVRKGHV